MKQTLISQPLFVFIHLIVSVVALLAIESTTHAGNAGLAATISLQQKPGDLLAGE
jgi:hypothetical protein